MAMAEGGGEGDALAEINVTPMVDVLLSLLIIFMVATPEPPNEKLPLAIPQDQVVEQPNDPNATLLITINADGTARLGKTTLPEPYDQMVEQIAANQKATRDGKLAVKADPKVPYGTVIRVMSAAHDAGISRVGVASERL